MSINYPTLAHFRHFSSLLTNLRSTPVENVRQITPFYAKQTQFGKWQNEYKHLRNNEIRKNGQLVIQTIQSQFKPNIEAQRKSRLFGNQSSLIIIEAQRKSRPLGDHLEGKSKTNPISNRTPAEKNI